METNTLIEQPQFSVVTVAPLAPDKSVASDKDDDVRTQVWGLLTTIYPKKHWVERRREQRYPFPYLVHLTPVGDDGITPEGESIVVVGKHLSERGLGFYHPKPLPHRRMVVSLEGSHGQWLGFLIDLTWCRFTRQHWYESGGRFLQAVRSPMADRPAE